MSEDMLTLTGLRARAHHGVYEFERRDGQDFVVDVVVHLSLSAAGRSDELVQTIHYGELAERIVRAVETDPVDLIETVAERVAGVVLAYPAAERTTVTVHKPQAPIPVPFDDVAVTITRSRAGDSVQVTGSVPVILALGSNLGDRRALLDHAVAEIREVPGVRVTGVSSYLETVALKPDGFDQTAPAYLNAVVAATVTLDPEALLRSLSRIERRHGRVREQRWGDRTLDIDIVTMGDLRWHSDRLTLPHPRAHEREFVLRPWLEVDPDAVLPGRGRVEDLLAELRSRE